MPFIIGMHSSALAIADPPADVRAAEHCIQAATTVPSR